ncbi:probable G-protein coupled receptor 139 [Watersipora subatra]|uniref:probable G-protein coupled receptor 139 n=1 Tax=Watersipora subatra TaxID=2589382 RepID=UPI00355C3D0D
MSWTNDTLLSTCPLEKHHIAYEIFSFTLNISSVLMNIFHILTLRAITSLRKKNYFWILVHLSLADILFGCFAIFRITETFLSIAFLLDNKISYFISDGLAFTAVHSRYTLVTFASFDRFYAVCHPYKYTSSKLLNEIGKSILTIWTVNVVYSVSVIVLLSAAGCVLRGETLPSLGNPKTTVTLVLFTSYTLLPLIMSTVFLSLTHRELKRMKRRTSFNEEQRDLTNTFNFIAGSFIMLYVTLVPLVVMLCLQVFSFDEKNLTIYLATQAHPTTHHYLQTHMHTYTHRLALALALTLTLTLTFNLTLALTLALAFALTPARAPALTLKFRITSDILENFCKEV